MFRPAPGRKAAQRQAVAATNSSLGVYGHTALFRYPGHLARRRHARPVATVGEEMARPARIERATPGFGGQYSIH